MADELEVDTAGLRTAAANSEATATGLTGAGFSGATSAQPSGGGVAAVNAALTSLRTRQSARITGQAGDLSTASARYDTTDEGGAGAITAVSV
ncbi:type VII secretion target [Mycobacterium sp. ITM-2016-00316]|nr:type VII secretion target [Mycobacterium sp. ITM-2016-00316]WNG79977.1 type VII secretion target [Mycobacterium sp. ITM-2016-00316]